MQQLTECRSNSYLSAGIYKAAHLLIFLTTLISFIYVQSDAQVVSQPARRLYQVHNKEKKSGFIDKTGKLVIGFDRFPAGTSVGDFSEGLATICFPDVDQGRCGKGGYIDETGEIIIAPRFRIAMEFSEGLAVAGTETLAGFIDHRGEVRIKLTNIYGYGSFYEGLAAVRTAYGFGFIDRSGKLITKEEYASVGRFSEGLAAVAVRRNGKVKYGFINREGAVVIPLQFDARVGNYGLVLDLGRFTEGLASVRIGDRYAYIDKKGNIVIPAQFRDAAEFSEGLASVTTAVQAGYIDKSGQFVIKLRSGGGYNFSEGLAAWAIETDRGYKLGYIDRTGKVIIEPEFDGAFGFVDGVAKVYVREIVTTASGRRSEIRVGYIDKTGKYLWEPQ